jgi:hypothetical protein
MHFWRYITAARSSFIVVEPQVDARPTSAAFASAGFTDVGKP